MKTIKEYKTEVEGITTFESYWKLDRWYDKVIYVLGWIFLILFVLGFISGFVEGYNGTV